VSPDAPPPGPAGDELSLAQSLVQEHRRLDELFGRFLSAATAGDLAAATEAIVVFDTKLRTHTATEEERVYPPPTGRKLLVPSEGKPEPQAERYRQLRLEHVQVREVSGIIRRLLSEDHDLESARRLAGNLARRWDAHTTREESEVYVAREPAPPER
jgi:hypothetical protein